jgi:hypothetical protein
MTWDSTGTLFDRIIQDFTELAGRDNVRYCPTEDVMIVMQMLTHDTCMQNRRQTCAHGGTAAYLRDDAASAIALQQQVLHAAGTHQLHAQVSQHELFAIVPRRDQDLRMCRVSLGNARRLRVCMSTRLVLAVTGNIMLECARADSSAQSALMCLCVCV